MKMKERAYARHFGQWQVIAVAMILYAKQLIKVNASDHLKMHPRENKQAAHITSQQ